MTLRVLVVEDDDNFVEELHAIIESLPGTSDVFVAQSRNEAYEMLADAFLDLVILDLTIPTVTRALDADPRHGHAVFDKIREVAPGTPIFVLTGSPAEDFVPEMLRNHQKIDIWGEGQETGTILFQKKQDFDECREQLIPIAQAIERLSDVELHRGDLELSFAEDRLVRIFTRRFRGVRCAVSQLSGGLSSARVMRLRVTNHQGVLVHDAVAKLSRHADIRRESDSYDAHVLRLVAGATPRKLCTLDYGAYKLAGIFFGLAEGSDASAFDVVGESDRAKAMVRGLESAMARWVDQVPETRKTIGEIRRRLLSDDSLDLIRGTFPLDWTQTFEDREIQARWACCHGDLHGKNIFVSPVGVQLIDYEDIGYGPASLDPVTLELSLLFHPDGPGKVGTWPSTEQAAAWGSLPIYLEGCPFAGFVRACRRWALRAAAGNREVAASAYGYLVRQLQYDDTDKDRVLALLAGVRSFYETNT